MIFTSKIGRFIGYAEQDSATPRSPAHGWKKSSGMRATMRNMTTDQEIGRKIRESEDADTRAASCRKSIRNSRRSLRRSGPFAVRPGKLVRPFDALAESIAYQQLSGKAAATIFGRVRALYPRRKWFSPELVIATPDESISRRGSLAEQDRSAQGSRGENARRDGPDACRARPDERRRDYRSPHDGARDWPVDGGDAPALRPRPARCLASRRLRSAQRLCEDISEEGIAKAERAARHRREMAALPIGRRVVFLASTGCAGWADIGHIGHMGLDVTNVPPNILARPRGQAMRPLLQ